MVRYLQNFQGKPAPSGPQWVQSQAHLLCAILLPRLLPSLEGLLTAPGAALGGMN